MNENENATAQEQAAEEAMAKAVNEAFDQEYDVKAMEKAVEGLGAGDPVMKAKGFSIEQVEAIYAVGLNSYKAGKYDDAEKVFRYIVYLDHTNSKYWIALGAVQQMLRQFPKAVTSYGYASFLDLHNPKPQFHAAECFLALGDKESAKSALAALEEYAPKDSVYREKAKKLAERL